LKTSKIDASKNKLNVSYLEITTQKYIMIDGMRYVMALQPTRRSLASIGFLISIISEQGS
jgi:hypothetical protein